MVEVGVFDWKWWILSSNNGDLAVQNGCVICIILYYKLYILSTMLHCCWLSPSTRHVFRYHRNIRLVMLQNPRGGAKEPGSLVDLIIFTMVIQYSE